MFKGTNSPFQELALGILASKCFDGVLTDSFHAFFTEINLKKLEKGIEYKVEDGTSVPVLPLVVKYVNLESQSPSLPLSFASACIDWKERTRNELPEDKCRRHGIYQTLIDSARKAAEEAFDKTLEKDVKAPRAFVLSRYIENKDIPLETIENKVEEQKNILRSGSVIHRDTSFTMAKRFTLLIGLALHQYRSSAASGL